MTTNFDFTPLFRSSIGFDRIFDMLESASRVQAMDNWPAYDIAKTGEDSYRITMAVAGFGEDQLTLTHQPNLLVVSGDKSGDEGVEYLHRGIAGRKFERRFELADHVQVTSANLSNGLLTIDLVREVPEAMKPRQIKIGGGEVLAAQTKPQIEAQKQAA